MVYQSGCVLHRRATSYADLLPLDSGREQKLKERVSSQHQAVMDELRSGALKLAQHATPAAPAKPSAGGEPKAAPSARNARDSLAPGLLDAQKLLARKPA